MNKNEPNPENPKVPEASAELVRRDELGSDYAEAILRAAPVAFLVLSAELRVHTASQTFYQAFQATPAETEGRLIYEMGNGQWNIPELRHLLEGIIPQENFFDGFEVTHEFPSIGSRTMLLNARRVGSGAGSSILLAIEDVTERRRAEGAMRRSTEDYKLLVEGATGFAIIRLELDGRVSMWNVGAERLLGYQEEEILGEHFSIFFTPEDQAAGRPERELRMARAAEKGDDDNWLVRKDGSRLWVSGATTALRDKASNLQGYAKIVRDMTSRRESELQLRESEERFRLLADNIGQLAWMADAEGAIFWYNQRWFNYTGTTLEEMQGWGWEKVHHPEHLARVVEKWRRHLAAGESWEDTFPLRNKDGDYHWFLSRAFPVLDEEGKVQRWFGSNTDITEQRAATDALARAKEQVEAASQAKDDFLAALSHELRTPLTPVLMTATALEGDVALPVEVRDQLSMMRRNIELEARLIDDLLDITRISRGKLTLAPIIADIHQLLEHTAEIVRSDGLGKQVRVVFVLEATRHHTRAEPTRLQQVFWNLIKNAVKFTPSGGSVTVRTRNDAEGWIVVSVEDNGVGISPQALPHIFTAFDQGDMTGKHRYGGLGLGLAISKAIVEAHGGTIQAESAGAGLGATFTVQLASVAAPVETAPPQNFQPGPAKALRLLVVEDHEATRTALLRLLSRNGHQVKTAGSIHEALLVFSAGRFDAVISDLGLPDGSGLDLMREIQRQRPVPGIALSGYGMEDDLRQTKAAGFFAHLVKPVNLSQLRLLLDQLGTRE